MIYLFLKSDSDRIQTCNLLIRSQMLYSVELRSRFAVGDCYAALLVVLSCSLLLLDAGFLTSEVAEVEDACSANFTNHVEFN